MASAQAAPAARSGGVSYAWVAALCAGAAAAACAVLELRHAAERERQREGGAQRAAAARPRARDGAGMSGVLACIGNTPLVRLDSLSAATGCEVLAKMELLNPGGSTKDRVAARIVEEALAAEGEGALREGAGVVTEGTAGSTGVSLAMVARARGLKCVVALPDDAAEEKVSALRALGAQVLPMRPVSITHPEHFVNVARRRAREEGGVFCDQFENLANFRAHRDGTGAEICEQLEAQWGMRPADGSRLAFICGAGTGGTLAGVHAALCERFAGARAFLADPQGSSLFNRVVKGVLYTREEAEGKRRANPFDTVVEGVGLNRLTANFSLVVDQLAGAARVSDREAVLMARYLRAREGLWVGSSSAINAAAATKLARALGPGHTVVTVLCDGGHRHLSKFWSDEYLAGVGLGVEEAFERRMLERACGAADDRGDELGFLEGEAAMAHACHAG